MPKIMVARPATTEYDSGPYIDGYLQAVEHEDAMTALRVQSEKLLSVESRWSDEQLDFRYALGKWSVRQVLGHMVDTERIFAFRMLAIARGEKQGLPGFDENAYQEAASFDQQSKETLFRQYELTRKSNLWLFETFDPSTLDRQGTANGRAISVRTLLWVLAGHENHHLRLFRERYRLPI